MKFKKLALAAAAVPSSIGSVFLLAPNILSSAEGKVGEKLAQNSDQLPSSTEELPAKQTTAEEVQTPVDGQRQAPESKDSDVVQNWPSYLRQLSKEDFEARLKKEAAYKTAHGYYVFNDELNKSDYLESVKKLAYDPKEPYMEEHPKTEWYKATEIIDILKDHTIRIFQDCTGGTSWILDYEIPEHPGSYPVKWFLVTAAHVLSKMRFTNNKYQQAVPGRDLCRRSTVTLMKDVKRTALERELWDWQRDPIKWTPERWEAYKSRQVVYSDISDINVFYVPANIFGEKWQDNFMGGYVEVPYMKDLAVLEVNFKDEEEAKLITDNFYYKFPPFLINDKDKKKVNFLSRASTSKNINFFFGGHPSLSVDHKQFSANYYTQTQEASRALGFSPPNFFFPSIQFDNKHYRQWGRLMTLNHGMSGGASGSLVVDEDLNVAGAFVSANADNSLGHVELIRWGGDIRSSEQKLLWPKYDFILGAKGQKTSYKQQLEKHYPNITTYLSKHENWSSQLV